MNLFELIYFPILPFVGFPLLALIPVAMLVWLWFARGRGTHAGPPLVIAALAWTAYAAWEISFKLVPTREWIRIDLLLIAPILLVLTVWAVRRALRTRA